MPGATNRQWFWGILFFAWSSFIFIYSILPGNDLVKLGKEDSGFRWDYLEHYTAFLLFSILFLKWRKTGPFKTTLVLLIIYGLLYASMTECIQLLIPTRSFNYIDLLFNIAGLTTGVILGRFLPYLRPAISS